MNIAPSRIGRLMLALLPFVLIATIYVVASAERRAVNPDDKLLPPVSEMADAVRRDEREVLVAAAWLHDIGYADELAATFEIIG